MSKGIEIAVAAIMMVCSCGEAPNWVEQYHRLDLKDSPGEHWDAISECPGEL